MVDNIILLFHNNFFRNQNSWNERFLRRKSTWIIHVTNFLHRCSAAIPLKTLTFQNSHILKLSIITYELSLLRFTRASARKWSESLERGTHNSWFSWIIFVWLILSHFGFHFGNLWTLMNTKSVYKMRYD